jgi:two-component system, chemotaxis family, CheB/CheR fusion protein
MVEEQRNTHLSREGPESAPRARLVPIVGIGASTGGVEAFRQLLAGLSGDTGLAFVLAQHLSPGHPSLLAETLSTATSMPVHSIEHGSSVVADQIMVVPPGVDVVLVGDHYETSPAAPGHARGHSIDRLFASLSARGSHCIGVILSGAGTDGVEGLRAIKAEGGVTFAQDSSSARVASMPEAAVRAGVVDHCLPPGDIAAEVMRLASEPLLSDDTAHGDRPIAEDPLIGAIIARVRAVTAVDLGDYKAGTIRRRVARRMALRRLASLDEYLACLDGDADEVRHLLEDVLIHVTSFFRDAAAFDVLATRVLPVVMAAKAPGAPIRIWVPGCSTGEEAYSLAMSFIEILDTAGRDHSVLIFGSDLSEAAISRARAGVYSDEAVRPVGLERLARFFNRETDGYRVKPELRERCVFVRHDVTRDPPFSRIDLVSCRNLLIYFGARLQRRVLTQFHYALGQPGFLSLGKAESVLGLDELFTPLEKNLRIYARSTSPGHMVAGHTGQMGGALPSASAVVARPSSLLALQRQVDMLLISRYAPAGVVVDGHGEILHVHGRTTPFLEVPPGQPTTSIFRMAREGLAVELRSAIERAGLERVPIRRDNLAIRVDQQLHSFDLEVSPLAGPSDLGERCFLVLFLERRDEPVPTATGPRVVTDEHIHLEHELATTRLYMQSLVDELQHAGGQLRTANEELLATNEELQSTNEEMETAREELQASNEELITVNEQLHGGNLELGQVNDDLINLLASVEIPIVIVSSDHRIRRFTPRAQAIMSFIAGDLGRPIDDLRINLQVDDLGRRIDTVLSSGAASEDEVQDRDGRWYSLHLRPYRTSSGVIDGVVMSMVDIDVLKHAVQTARHASEYAAAIVDTVPTPLLILDDDLLVLHGNRTFFTVFALEPRDVVGRMFSGIAGGAWLDPVLLGRLHNLAHNDRIVDYLMPCRLAGQPVRTTELSASHIDGLSGARLLLVAISDITERMLIESERKLLLDHAEIARRDAERANGAKDLFLATLSHELRTPLSTILMQASMLSIGDRPPAQLRQSAVRIERAAHAQARMIDDLLDTSRIVSGQLNLVRERIDLAQLVVDACEALTETARRQGVDLIVDTSVGVLMVDADAGRIQQVVWNLVNNALKFTPQGGQVTVTLAVSETSSVATIAVTDTGCGLDPVDLERIFVRFVQVGDSRTNRLGLGLGLAIVRHVVEAHGGRVRAASDGVGRGSSFIVELPPATTTTDRTTWPTLRVIDP